MAPVRKILKWRGHRSRKHGAELAFWRERRAAEGRLGAGHYEWVFTAHHGLETSFYDAKRMLDVGCGPRGSLEWAAGASARVGADPLVGGYRELGIDEHAMDYVEAGAESLPFADGSFDVISCFNALDHVDDPAAALAEMVRVLAPGGTFLAIVEVGHEPTVHEPHTLGWDVLDAVAPPLRVLSARRYERSAASVYDVLIHAEPLPDAVPAPVQGFLSTRLAKDA